MRGGVAIRNISLTDRLSGSYGRVCYNGGVIWCENDKGLGGGSKEYLTPPKRDGRAPFIGLGFVCSKAWEEIYSSREHVWRQSRCVQNTGYSETLQFSDQGLSFHTPGMCEF